MTSQERKPFFERLKAGLEEGIAFCQGELSLKTVQFPEEPPRSIHNHWRRSVNKPQCLKLFSRGF